MKQISTSATTMMMFLEHDDNVSAQEVFGSTIVPAMEPRRMELMSKDPLYLPTASEQCYDNLCGIASISSDDIDDCSDCGSLLSDFTDDDDDDDDDDDNDALDCSVNSETVPLHTVTTSGPVTMKFEADLGPVSVISPGSTPLSSLAGIEDNSIRSSVYDDDDDDDDDDDMMSLMSASMSLIDFETIRFIPVTPLSSSSSLPKRDMISNVLPDELVWAVTSFLNVQDLQHVKLLSKRFSRLASHDEAGWSRHCQRLWSHKSLVCAQAKSLFAAKQSMLAYHSSIHDARQRQEIQMDELVFDPEQGSGTVWDFRFKDTAGTDWTSFDPWFHGRDARKLVFLRDGSVKQLTGKDTMSLQPPFHDMTDNNNNNHENHAPSRVQKMSWRFIAQPMDLPQRPMGAYIRLTVDGREVPTYVVHRSPSGNWGFVIESCWGVFSSSRLARRNDPTTPTRQHHARMRLRRTRDGWRWLNVQQQEEEEDEQHAQESNFSISMSRQWREALLYNYGAVNLPEGQDATAEFDRVWNQSIRSRR